MISRKIVFKIAAMLLIQSFLCLDFAWASDINSFFSYNDFLSPKVCVNKTTFETVFFNMLRSNEDFAISQNVVSKITPYIINLGEVSEKEGLGAKVNSFTSFHYLNMNYPEGVYILPDLIKIILDGDEKLLDLLVDDLIKRFPEYNADYSDTMQDEELTSRLLSVRSAPVQSMPGVLGTVLNVGSSFLHDEQSNPSQFLTMLKNKKAEELERIIPEIEKESKEASLRDEFKKALRAVIFSWQAQKAIRYRSNMNMPEDEIPAIIVQKMVFGNLNSNSVSGVIYSRDPNTRAKKISGSYIKGEQGIELVSGSKKGVPIENLEKEFPEAFKELMSKVSLLEKFKKFPQEVEFTIQDEKTWFLQARDICFAPQTEIKYWQESMELGKVSLPNILSRIEYLQQKTMFRTVYNIKQGIKMDVLGNGVASTPGAMYGTVVFDVKEAKHRNAEGEKAILLVTENNREMIDDIFELREIGIITTYGDGSSHEAVLTRWAGIPSIINIGSDVVKKLKRGAKVGIDGNKNLLFLSEDEEILVEDKSVMDMSHGVNIAAFERDYLKEALHLKGKDSKSIYDESSEVLKSFSLNKLYVMREIWKINWRQCEKKNQGKEAFISNVKQHVWHKLILRKASMLSIEPLKFPSDLSQHEKWLLSICAQLIEKGVNVNERLILEVEKIIKNMISKKNNESLEKIIINKEFEFEIDFMDEQVKVKMRGNKKVLDAGKGEEDDIKENLKKIEPIKTKNILKEEDEKAILSSIKGLYLPDDLISQAMEALRQGESAGPYEWRETWREYSPPVYKRYVVSFHFLPAVVVIDYLDSESHTHGPTAFEKRIIIELTGRKKEQVQQFAKDLKFDLDKRVLGLEINKEIPMMWFLQAKVSESVKTEVQNSPFFKIRSTGHFSKIGEDSEGENVYSYALKYMIKDKFVENIDFSLVRLICGILSNLRPAKVPAPVRDPYPGALVDDIMVDLFAAKSPTKPLTLEQQKWVSRFQNIKDDDVLVQCIVNIFPIIRDYQDDGDWENYIDLLELSKESKAKHTNISDTIEKNSILIESAI